MKMNKELSHSKAQLQMLFSNIGDRILEQNKLSPPCFLEI